MIGRERCQCDPSPQERCGITPRSVSTKIMDLQRSSAPLTEVHDYITQALKDHPNCEESIFRFAQMRFPGLFDKSYSAGQWTYTLRPKSDFQ
jgi:hypothetical protein